MIYKKQFVLLFCSNVMVMGRVRIISDVSVRVGIRLITFIWSCTSFLAPKTNG